MPTLFLVVPFRLAMILLLQAGCVATFSSAVAAQGAPTTAPAPAPVMAGAPGSGAPADDLQPATGADAGAAAPETGARPHRYLRSAMYAPLHVTGKTRFSTPDGESSHRLGLGRGFAFRLELAFRRVVSLGVMAEWTAELTEEAWEQRVKPLDNTLVFAPWILIAHTFESVAGGLQLGVALHAGSTRWYTETEMHRGPDLGAFLVARLFTGPGFAVFVEAGVRHRRLDLGQVSARATQLALHAGLLFGL